MKTLRIAIDPEDLESEASRAAIETAAAILRQGGLVAFPTETVYGLGANALSVDAVEKIFRAKQRPAWDPLIVHISSANMLAEVAKTPDNGPARELMRMFWPGPLTLLLRKTEQVPDMVTAGRPLVGIRMPAHPVARALIAAAGVPVAAPSANSFGGISPTLAAHVLEDLDGRIDAVLDGGETAHGLESTVVDASREPVVLYRPGVITIEMLRAICGEIVEWKPSDPQSEAPPESMPAPGAGIRHYAPKARLIVIEEAFGEPVGHQAGALFQAVQSAAQACSSVGILLPTDHPAAESIRAIPRTVILDWGNWSEPEMLAHRLFAGLRELDAIGAQVIVCPLPPPEGIGAAIRDRLLKAARVI